MTQLASTLTTTAQRHPDGVALKLDDAELTWTQLLDRAATAAGSLRAQGLQTGDRVALILPNIPAFPVLFYGTLLAGGVVVPMNPLLKAGEIEYFFSDSGARFAFAWGDFLGQAQEGAEGTTTQVIASGPLGPDAADLPPAEPITTPTERGGEDTAVILYTSGTTGRPKGAELTHDNLRLNAERAAEDVIEITEHDTIMGCLPLFHVFGLTCALNTAVRSGATLTLLPRFDPGRALEIIARDRVTVFEGVPTMYGAMLHHPDAATADLSSLRTCVSGGSSLPEQTLTQFEKTFDAQILEGYGLSETSPVASFNMPDRPTKPGTIGRAITGCEMKLVGADGKDVGPGEGIGEIAIRGDNVMKGYWGRPEETAQAIPDGWFRTGDLARVDEDGYYTIVDRTKDMILRGGMNVYPREIEEVLYSHPDVRECAVVGVPHEELGEEVGAAISLREGASVDVAEIQDYVKQRIAAYKYPRTIWILDELPKGSTGKLLKRKIHPPENS